LPWRSSSSFGAGPLVGARGAASSAAPQVGAASEHQGGRVQARRAVLLAQQRRSNEPATKRRRARRAAGTRRWSAWFEGLQISSGNEPGVTTIAGPVADQAALHGLLAKVRDLALPLLSVRRIDPDHEPTWRHDATITHPDASPRPQRPQRLRVARRQRRPRPTGHVDRRTPSGRLLPY
jgi:hypothetical protein